MTPQMFDYHTESAFPQLVLDQPISLTFAPGDAERMFILEKTGRILTASNDSEVPHHTVFLDLKDRIFTESEAGLLRHSFATHLLESGTDIRTPSTKRRSSLYSRAWRS